LPPNSVSGFIRDADGNPVAGVEVDLAFVEKNGDTGGGDTVTTDETGYYRTALYYGGPRPGQRYYLYVGANGGYLTFDGRGRWTVKNVPKVFVPLGDTPTILDITLPATVPVSGKLLWANGKPAAGQRVEASSTSRGAGQTIGSTRTDKQGRFTLDLPPGSYVLWTTLSRGDPRFLDVTVKTRPIKGLVGRLPFNR
jgi:5-hydroxyisourate hydrolase-like protein (transthyretin family)